MYYDEKRRFEPLRQLNGFVVYKHLLSKTVVLNVQNYERAQVTSMKAFVVVGKF